MRGTLGLSRDHGEEGASFLLEAFDGDTGIWSLLPPSSHLSDTPWPRISLESLARPEVMVLTGPTSRVKLWWAQASCRARSAGGAALLGGLCLPQPCSSGACELLDPQPALRER